MPSYQTSGVVLETGITAAIQAGTTGPQMNVSGFRIGYLSATDGIVAQTTDTDVDGFVFAGDTSMLTYNQVDQDTIVWIVTLPTTVGNFNVGNICITLTGGANLVKAVLPGQSPKYQSNLPAVVGNTKVYNIVMHLSNASSIINLSVLTANLASLPTVPTEASLPTPSSTPYNAYLVQNHTHMGIPTVAISLNNTWNHAPHFLYPGVGDSVVAAATSLFATAALSGSLPAPTVGVVGWNTTLNQFVAGDPSNPSSGVAGIRISSWQVMTAGQIPGVDIGVTGTLVPGTVYYCNTGANAGTFTSVANATPSIGVAVSATDIWIDMSGLWMQSIYAATMSAAYIRYGLASGLNTLTATVTPALSSIKDGMLFELTPATTNTAAVSIVINGLASMPLINRDGSALIQGTIVANEPFQAMALGTNLILMTYAYNMIPQGALLHYGVATGSNVITTTVSPPITSVVDGMVFEILPTANNTGAVTLAPNALPAMPVVAPGGAALPTNSIVANEPILLIAVGGNLILLTPNMAAYSQIYPGLGSFWITPMILASANYFVVGTVYSGDANLPATGSWKCIVVTGPGYNLFAGLGPMYGLIRVL